LKKGFSLPLWVTGAAKSALKKLKGLPFEDYELIKIPKDKIEEFLIFCDDNFPSRILLKKDNEFELIDFLVKQSEKYQKILN